MSTDSQPSAAMIIIGNEILSGRTKEGNMNYVASGLTSIGVQLCEGAIIPDIEKTIVDKVLEYSKKYDYVFTSGGIGPTHDDITAASIARAFGRAFILHPEAEQILNDYYGDKITEARLRMAMMPEDAELIPNPVSAAPGFIIQNVHVMAGVPLVMQAMFDWLKSRLKGGPVTQSITLSAHVPESKMADHVATIQQTYPSLDIGSYPQIRNGTFGVSIVLRGINDNDLQKAASEVRLAFKEWVDDVIEGEL